MGVYGGGWRLRHLHHHLVGSLVLAHALEARMPQAAVRRYFGISDLGNEVRFHPPGTPCDISWHRREGWFVETARFELGENVPAHRLGEAGANAASVNQLAIFIGAKDERSQTSTAIAWAISADNELLSLGAFDLEPVVRAVADVATVGSLGDDTFVAALAHGLKHLLALADNMAGKLQAIMRVAGAQEGLEPFLPLKQRLARDILAIHFKQIERVEFKWHSGSDAGLQHGEVGAAFAVDGDDLAIDQS